MFSRFSWLLELNFFLTKLVYNYKYQRKVHWKNYDEWRRYLTFSTFRNKAKKTKRVIEVWATKNFTKDKITLFWENCKKIKLNTIFLNFRVIYHKRSFSVPVTSFQLFCNFLRYVPEYIDNPVILFIYEILVAWAFLDELHLMMFSRFSWW